MKLNHFIYAKCKTIHPNRLLLKLYKNKINVYDSVYQKEELYLKIKKEDYERLKKEIVTQKFVYVSETGFFKIKQNLTPLRILILVCFLLFTNFFSQVIVKVEVIHSNKEIRALVSKALESEGIHIWSFKKDYNTLQESKQKILAMHKNELEWIEIENVGMKYIVRIEERILKEFPEEKNYCHIVASKSGIIESIMSTKGEILVHEGQYVAEGEPLISGEIKWNEEVKDNVCASGSVYAEVWYETNVSLPKDYEVIDKTGKKRWNFSVETESGKYKIFKSRLKNYETESKMLFHFFNFTFYWDTEYETTKTSGTYTLESGTQKALELADEKIKAKFLENEQIKLRKVLKNTINDSTIDVEIFYSVIENIGISKEYTIAIEKEGS